jgi:hypothetical protein
MVPASEPNIPDTTSKLTSHPTFRAAIELSETIGNMRLPVYGLQIKKKGRDLHSLCQPAQGSAGSQKRRSA